MIKVVFKNLKKSELARSLVHKRMESLMERFPDFKVEHLTVTLRMENSPLQAGPDVFKVKVYVGRGRYRGLSLEKSGPNLYAALADVDQHLLERLNRFGDKTRVKSRNQSRKWLQSKFFLPWSQSLDSTI